MKNSIIGSTIVATLLLVGCGSNSDSTTEVSSNATAPTSAEAEKKIGTGYYVDAAVEGITFQCGTETGLTDANGTFTFEENATCTFSVGEIVLREVNASFLEDNVTILEDQITVAQLLQTLDADGNATNGILIAPGTAQVLRESNILEIPEDDAVLASIRDDLKASNPDYNGTAVSREDAERHLGETKQRLADEGRRTQHDANETREEGRNPNFDGNETHSGDNRPNFDGNETGNGQNRPDFDGNETHNGENRPNFDQNRTRPEGRGEGRG